MKVIFFLCLFLFSFVLGNNSYAQELIKKPVYDIRSINEIVIGTKIINGKYTVSTAQYSKFSTPIITRYVVCDLVYYYVKKKDKFNPDYLIKLLRKNPYDRRIFILRIRKAVVKFS